jgi:2,3-bisphosphoglycerate-independent phosphoglycerate mutase
MKYVIFLGDGMSDRPHPDLGGKTPLDVAAKPHMDRIARMGVCGSFITLEPDMPTGSATANLMVLGYDPRQYFGSREGRGVLEAASMGILLGPEDLAMRVNLISLDGEKIKNHSAGHISSEEAAQLIGFLDKNLDVAGARLYPGVSYRHLLVIPGGDERIECSPPHDHVGETIEDQAPQAEDPEAIETTEKLWEIIRRSRDLLADHPVNRERWAAGKDTADCLWPWAPGHPPKMPTLKEKYGVTGTVISAVDLVRGVGVYAGLGSITVPGATGLYDTNYEGKAGACLDALKRTDFVYVHVEASDEAGHERDAHLKVRTIEYLDQRLIRLVMEEVGNWDEPVTMAVLSDHATPIESGKHVRDPVPVAIWNPSRPPDSVRVFNEEAVKEGSLGILRGSRFMDEFLGRPD